MEMNLKFKKLKKYISVIDRVSICMRETLRYENYRFLRDVPEKYDELYVYGIGMIDSEFKIENPEEYIIEQAIQRILKAKGNYLYFYEHVDAMGEEYVSDKKIQELCEEMKAATRLWAEIMRYADRVVASKTILRRFQKGE